MSPQGTSRPGTEETAYAVAQGLGLAGLMLTASLLLDTWSTPESAAATLVVILVGIGSAYLAHREGARRRPPA